ncbi:uncharacterized protein N7511_001924 [Penicillium nucicola]|uniref:uncharacterized protein n=1 Tax=Penicillium nucicola TaxID=1850975 RepID=UPI00254545CA|nr:uncharacterized protein N7511_001924 [Penicillium nucicola]KAJ5769873.1 hypothetical protein N7511_001924 [Penicillium nucicola]
MAERSSFEVFVEARFKLQDLIQRIIFDLRNHYPLLRREIKAGLAFICIYVDIIRGLERLMAPESLSCKAVYTPDTCKDAQTDLERTCRLTDEMVHVLSQDLEFGRNIDPVVHSLELLNHRWSLNVSFLYEHIF